MSTVTDRSGGIGGPGPVPAEPAAPNSGEGPTSPLLRRIADNVASLRRQRNLSLHALAAASGVSRSMISVIERGGANPTASVLERLATGLDVPLSSLLEEAGDPGEPVARAADQQVWRDPVSGYLRRDLSPRGLGSPLLLAEVELPARTGITHDSDAGPPRHHQVWVLSGALEVTVSGVTHHLRVGDCIDFGTDGPHAYRNTAAVPTRYLVATTHDPGARR